MSFKVGDQVLIRTNSTADLNGRICGITAGRGLFRYRIELSRPLNGQLFVTVAESALISTSRTQSLITEQGSFADALLGHIG